MLKKILLLLTFGGLLEALILGCCPDPMTFHSTITGIQADVSSLEEGIADSATIPSADLRIRCFIEEEERVVQRYTFFFNQAQAVSCIRDHRELEPDIVQFELQCNKEILDIEAGQPLNNNIKLYLPLMAPDNYRTASEFVELMNTGGNWYGHEWFIVFNSPIQSNDFLMFTLFFELANGTTIEATTKAVRLQ